MNDKFLRHITCLQITLSKLVSRIHKMDSSCRQPVYGGCKGDAKNQIAEQTLSDEHESTQKVAYKINDIVDASTKVSASNEQTATR